MVSISSCSLCYWLLFCFDKPLSTLNTQQRNQSKLLADHMSFEQRYARCLCTVKQFSLLPLWDQMLLSVYVMWLVRWLFMMGIVVCVQTSHHVQLSVSSCCWLIISEWRNADVFAVTRWHVDVSGRTLFSVVCQVIERYAVYVVYKLLFNVAQCFVYSLYCSTLCFPLIPANNFVLLFNWLLFQSYFRLGDSLVL